MGTYCQYNSLLIAEMNTREIKLKLSIGFWNVKKIISKTNLPLVLQRE